MRSLSVLSELLSVQVGETSTLSESRSLKPLLDLLSRQVGSARVLDIPENAQREAISAFWTRKRIDTFKDARLVAFGLAMVTTPKGICILDDSEYFEYALRDIGQWYGRPSLFRRCYQGLLASYFAFDAEPTSTGMTNWESLREYLAARTNALSDSDFIPVWVRSLLAHPELFTSGSCERLGQLELEGKEDYVSELKSELLVGDSSWFSRELYFGKVRAACTLPDEAFVAQIPRLLAVVEQNVLYHDRGLGLLLERYAECESPSMNRPLRDHTVGCWGNPWLHQNAALWGHVNEKARTLLSEWLKLEFIESFFTLLAEDGQSDKRRMNFWKGFVNEIDDIRFALGPEAQDSTKRDFVDLKKKAQGLIVPLSDGSPTNNAFIMTIKGHVMVEFSGTANATYIYRSDDALPFDVRRPVRSAKNVHNSLKSDGFKLRLTHQDGILGFVRWEERFADALNAKCGITSTSVPARKRALGSTSSSRRNPGSHAIQQTRAAQGTALIAELSKQPYAVGARDWSQTQFSIDALIEFCREFDLTIDNKRSKGGLLWVRDLAPAPSVTTVLSQWGFRFRTDKGWWRL